MLLLKALAEINGSIATLTLKLALTTLNLCHHSYKEIVVYLRKHVKYYYLL